MASKTRRPRSMSKGADEKDLPPLSDIPALDCPKALLYRYFANKVSEVDANPDEIAICGGKPSQRDPYLEDDLRARLRAERDMAAGLYAHLASSTWLAVAKEQGLIATASSFFDMARNPARGAVDHAFVFCLRQVPSPLVAKHANSVAVAGSRLAYFQGHAQPFHYHNLELSRCFATLDQRVHGFRQARSRSQILGMPTCRWSWPAAKSEPCSFNLRTFGLQTPYFSIQAIKSAVEHCLLSSSHIANRS